MFYLLQVLALIVCGAIILVRVPIGSCQKIQLVQNGYEDIVVGIDRNIPQIRSSQIVTSLKKLFNASSSYLYQSTRQRSYFSKITILAPPTWSRVHWMELSASETYETADIKIESFGPRSVPHVDRMSVECGQGGQAIIIPEDFLSYVELYTKSQVDYDPGRWFVQVWSQFRYGVYDEHGYAKDGTYPYFYLDEKMTIPMPTACSTADLLLGDVIDVRNGKRCKTMEEILDGGYCEYQLSHTYDITNSSINYANYFSPITQFCDSAENQHNDRAPTKQNAYCSYQSSWSIIETSPDFQNGSNGPRDVADTTPQIRVIYPSELHIVLAFDTSDESESWSRQGVLSFIKYGLTLGSYVGVVAFSTEATVVLNMIHVKTNSDRQLVIESIPRIRTGQKSCIGCGIRESLKILKDSTSRNGGGVIVLISDGSETKAPYVKDVYSSALRAHVQLYWMSYGNHTVDHHLPDLVTETRGQLYFIGGGLAGAATLSSALFHVFNMGQPIQKVMLVDDFRTSTSDPDSVISGYVPIDSDVGKDIVVTMLYDPQQSPAPRLNVLGPHPSWSSPASYSNLSSDGITAISIPLAMIGEWTYTIENTAPNQNFSIAVTSAARNGGQPQTRVEAWTNVGFREVNLTERPVILFASIKKGSYPVLNVDVRALVTGPCKGSTEISLLDGGNLPDFQQLDGVYSRYFTSFCGGGYYSFQVRVHGGIDATDYSWSTYHKDFHRVTIGGSFVVLNDVYEKMNDTSPPARILDLNVAQNASFRESGLALFEWTAPGDDYDFGTADHYVMKYSNSFAMVHGDGFMSNTEYVTKDMVVEGSLDPLPAGSRQWVVVHFPPGEKSCFVAITAVDDSDNSPPESNVVRVLNLQFVCQYAGQSFTDTKNCSIYYVCENAGFPPTQMECPSGLCYYAAFSTCEWPI